MTCVCDIHQLRLKFPGEKSLLFRDLSLTIYQGEKVLLLGPSGCGKSTLLQVLTGLIPNSVDIPLKYDRVTIPSSWGYVFQDPDTQFCMPYVDEEIAFVLENLKIPRKQMPALIQKYLDDVGLELSDLHTNIQKLSQGMKQRLAIASVLALEPDVLFLDEPTALLDPEGTEQVWNTIKHVGKEKTLLIVEHKLDQVIDIVDRVILFNDQGEIIADGDKDKIFKMHQKELIEFGIWYPGVWEHYIKSSSYNELKGTSVNLASLQDFTGYRGKEQKISVSDAKINRGEWIGVIGGNGAGKSTLLLALMQLIQTKGTYLVNQEPIEKIKNLSEYVGFVFQNPEFQFVTNSVYDEIAYTLNIHGAHQQKIEEKVYQILSFFQLLNKKDQHPYQLSMGQKRRLSVATAVVADQDILLLDEPTFGQDAKNTFHLLEKIEQCRQQGTTILMVTHDINVIKHFATRVWLIEHGRLELDMKPSQYLEKYNREYPTVQQEATAWL